jgi:hypothetical protein
MAELSRLDAGHESGQIICHALGIDPAQCRAVDICWRVGEMPYARVELWLNERAVFQIIQLAPVSESEDSDG